MFEGLELFILFHCILSCKRCANVVFFVADYINVITIPYECITQNGKDWRDVCELYKSNRHGFNCSAFTLRRILTRCKSLEYQRFHIWQTTWKVRGKEKLLPDSHFFFFFTILCTVTCILHCPTMLFHGHTMNNTIWNNTEIWGCNQVFEKRGKKKKKGNGHRRVKTRFCGGRNGIVPRGFSIWPPEEVIFKDIRFFLMVINIFLPYFLMFFIYFV